MTSATEVTWEIDDSVVVITLDDGRVNALSSDILSQLAGALEFSLASGRAVCLVGREGHFSAGYDRSAIADPTRSADLVDQGGRFLDSLYGHPQPVVAAVTGHALGIGAAITMACDIRIGANGNFKIGITETSLGLPLSLRTMDLARDRIATTSLARCVLKGEALDPERALEAGFLDDVVDPGDLTEAAISQARTLGAYRASVYRKNKLALRAPTLRRWAALNEAQGTVTEQTPSARLTAEAP